MDSSGSDSDFNLRVMYAELTGLHDRPVRFPLPADPRKGLIGYTDEITGEMVCSAYLQGVFPWFDEERNEPALWWSPDPRFVLPVEKLYVGSRLERFIKHTPYTYSLDRDFPAVINGCASVKRSGQHGTWIGKKMRDIYCTLAEKGIAHSVEAWDNGILAGGLYGVLIGSVFFGESMFTLRNNSAKSAFVLFARAFAAAGGRLIDSQVYTDNMARYGACNISRAAFLRLEREYLPCRLKCPLCL
jgi:leucyl/phenylalanyl-tRNA---protein transferase